MTAPISPTFPLLRIHGLSLRGAQGAAIVDGLSFDISAGEVVALVGESGSGKTITGRAVMGLLPPQVVRTGGAIVLDGRDLTSISDAEMRKLRGDSVGMVFQDPTMSLNPAMRIGPQLCEGLQLHGQVTRTEARRRSMEMLEQVRVSDAKACLERFPHQFSEGIRQRIMLASVMLRRPRLLIADEPTSALDSLTQRDIIEVMIELTRRSGTAVLLITHDLGLVARCATAVVVLRRGRLVEAGNTEDTLRSPRATYTRRLVDAIPRRDNSRPPVPPSRPLIEAREVSVKFRSDGWLFGQEQEKALDRVTLCVKPRETVALVGGSGSGKTTLGRALVGLLPLSGGSIHFRGTEMTLANAGQRRDYRLACQIVFQDPYASLDPRQRVGEIVAEPLRHCEMCDGATRLLRVSAILEEVELNGLDARYPHELSAGQRQRVAIARALIRNPDFIVADEPLSTLDVITQRQLVALFKRLQAQYGFSCVFITHSLAVASTLADRVAVMKHARIVEEGSVDEIFDHPQDGYTRRLIDATMVPDFGAVN